MHIDLTGKRVIVSGASRGIGLAIASAFAREGARTAICARARAPLDQAAEALAGQGAQAVIARPVDVRDTSGVRDFVAEVAQAWGGIDVLVNNAGQGMNGQVDTVEPETLLAHADLTQVSHYRFSQAVIPHMRKQRWGRIIDINAMAGLFPGPGITSSINRAACLALTRSLAQTVARDNILVNGLNMGWIDTGQWDRHHREMGPGVGREDFRAMVEGVIPFGRFGRPEEVAGMALFLASDFASYITGASIDVSGALNGQMNYLPALMGEMRARAAERV